MIEWRDIAEKLDMTGSCWLWTGWRKDTGYGRIRRVVEGRRAGFRVHRIAYEICNGPVPDGLHVLHSCDNPACCNPSHLRVGTHAQNMADVVSRKRHKGRAGEGNNNAKLTAEIADEIRASKESNPVLASRHGVCVDTVWKIKSGRLWGGTP